MFISSSYIYGQAPVNYFPLDVGNTWVYTGWGSLAGQSVTLQITRTEAFKNRTYALLHGYPGRDYWLRQEGESTLSYDPAQDREASCYAFVSPEHEVYQT